jgi:RimJ/RimL family protein N-acetyltransferase
LAIRPDAAQSVDMSRLHDDVPWPVVTDRLVLRPATAADADALYAIRSRPDVAEWVTSAWTDRDDFQSGYVDTARYGKVIVIERDGEVIGELMISIEDGWAQREVEAEAAGVQAELGWVLSPEHGGLGYATEAVAAALSVCFEQLGLRRVVANCYADNVASWRLMERIGMRRETTSVHDSLHRTRGWLDGYGYAILADEWPRPSV